MLRHTVGTLMLLHVSNTQGYQPLPAGAPRQIGRAHV